MFLYPSYGFMQSVGTVQSYLQLNQLSDYTARDLGWISGIFTSLGLLLGIQAGPLMDAYGTRLLAPISAATLVPLFFLLGECTEYWHFILCLGVLGGISSALTSTVAMAVIGKLFSRRRGLAMVCIAKTCDPKDYGRYLGTMNFVVSFSLLITVPIGGQMLESMGGTALSGFYVAVLFLGGVSYFAGRSLLVGGWFTFRTRI
ncbi:hypothetical protein K4K59_008917 [Colletotrichum sp. SAR11_240]|nr:hypothetical protein K4K59_008917 [Colletotrichum sp. SAR11_240]